LNNSKDKTMLLCDTEIREQIAQGMIDGAELEQVRQGVISYGVTSYGYDMRCADEWQVFRHDITNEGGYIDPKEKNLPELMYPLTAKSIVIPAGAFVLCRSVEYFRIPKDILCIVLGKSTYARCGLIVNCTPLEPGWEGHVTIELSNTASIPIRVYGNEGIAQVLFMRGNPCSTSYADKKGKYQGQTGITLPTVE
jgi:dCTP deaminase